MNLIEAVYEHGVFTPIGNPGLADGQSVKIILDSEKDGYFANTEDIRKFFEHSQFLLRLESLECSNQQPQCTDFTQWIGYAKRSHENPQPRFRTDDDLWR
jgi:predicted DNA-binding antitoxin AbrB/MazE fold protein